MKFSFYAQITSFAVVEIEAESKKEAREAMLRIDGIEAPFSGVAIRCTTPYLWERIRDRGQDGRTPREVIEEMLAAGMIASPKQAWATLTKWTDKKRYSYGVCLDLGWRNPPEEWCR